MKEDYPTEEELDQIENWPYESFDTLARHICENLWHFEDWAVYREPAKDDFDNEYRELRLATAGWSGNESIISALHRNKMFGMLCWQSSHRGGLHIYHIPVRKK